MTKNWFFCAVLFFLFHNAEAVDDGLDDLLNHDSGNSRVFFKIDQGFRSGRFLDQRMSNLHYSGPGAVINFSRYAYRKDYNSELSFARFYFNPSLPRHKNTIVYNAGGGIRYLHLNRVSPVGPFQVHVGGEVNFSADARYAPRLANSFLFADFIANIRPKAEFSTTHFFLWKDWDIDLSLAWGLGGYALSLPRYGVSYRLADDGGVALQGYKGQILHPANYLNLTTSLFIRESFGGAGNPNWFRAGYIWEYSSVKTPHDLYFQNAAHKFVLELYFRVN